MFVSCGILDFTETTSENWIAICNIDGSNLEYICESGGEFPIYFVPDLNNPEEELLLLAYSNMIDLMNQDGTERKTILDSIGSVFSFSQDRTKMLLNHEGEIYIANSDGSELHNLTNSPDIYERHPRFSIDESNIVFTYGTNSNSIASLAIMDLITNSVNVIREINTNNTDYKVYFSYPAFYSTTEILYTYHWFDQTQLPANYGYVFYKYDYIEEINQVVIDSTVYDFTYDNLTNYCVVDLGSNDGLLNMDTLEFEHFFAITHHLGLAKFSSSSNYIVINDLVYNRLADYEYFIELEESDFNQSETKTVGIASRTFPESKDD